MTEEIAENIHRKAVAESPVDFISIGRRPANLHRPRTLSNTPE